MLPQAYGTNCKGVNMQLHTQVHTFALPYGRLCDYKGPIATSTPHNFTQWLHRQPTKGGRAPVAAAAHHVTSQGTSHAHKEQTRST
jgi:hypothetical protein